MNIPHKIRAEVTSIITDGLRKIKPLSMQEKKELKLRISRAIEVGY